MTLLACPACSRHVRRSETSCPFCHAALSLPAAAPRAALPRLGRAAVMAFGAAALTTTAACSTTTSPSDDTGTDAPAVETDSGTETDAPSTTDTGGEADTGTPETDAGMDAGGIAPAYGGPIFVDAPSNVDAGGGAVPLYGGPPPAE